MEKKIQTLAVINTTSFSVALDEVRLRNGDLGKRIKISHPQAAAVVPFLTDDEIIMVRQYRYALGRETLEIPAGKMDPGEDSDTCIKRELLEETGYEAGRIERLYAYAPAIGYSDEVIHLYAGYALKRVRATVDEREIASVERVGIGAVRTLIGEGRIQDGKTLLALAFLGIVLKPE